MRDEKGHWIPGSSGNPQGRKKLDQALAKRARKHTKAVLERLVELLGSRDERVALMAGQELLDRGYGKAPAKLELTGEDGGPLVSAVVTNPNARELAEIGTILAEAGAFAGAGGTESPAGSGGGEADPAGNGGAG